MIRGKKLNVVLTKLPEMVGVGEYLTGLCPDSPLSLGYLKAYCQQFSDIRERVNLEMMHKQYYDTSFLRVLRDKGVETLDKILPLVEMTKERYPLESRFLYLREEFVSSLMKYEPDIVAFSVYVWNIQETKEVARLIKERDPEIRIVCGGPEIEYESSHFNIFSPFDVMAYGEGEVTFYELLQYFLTRCPVLEEIRGIGFKGEGGSIHWTGERPRLMDINQIPSPYLSGVLKVEDSAGTVFLETARGCPFRCTYCNWGGGTGRNPPLVDLERSIREVCWAFENGVSTIGFIDAELNLYRGRLITLCSTLAQQNWGRKVKVEGDFLPHLLDDEIKRHLVRAGFHVMKIGLQSNTREVLHSIKRNILPRKALEGIRSLLPDLSVEIQMIIGLPGETLGTFMQLVILLNTDSVLMQAFLACFTLSILPNTELKHRAEEFGIVYDPEPPYMVQRTATMSEEDFEKARKFTRAVVPKSGLGISSPFHPFQNISYSS